MINKFNINTFYKSLKTFLIYHIQKIKNEKTTIKLKIQVYQQRVEFINFATIIIRSDLIFTASKLLELLINSLTYYMK